MAIQGLRLTDNFVTDQRPKNWREGVMLQYPNGQAPLYGLTVALKSRSVDDPEYNWWDKALDDRRFAVPNSAGNIAAGLTMIPLASGAMGLKAGDILYVEANGEQMRVAADPSSDLLVTVQRGFAGTTAAALATTSGTNRNLLKIGSAYEEASDAPTGVNFNPVKRYNFTQIFRNTMEMSRTAMKTRLRTGDQVKEAKRETLESHSIDIERALWFGAKSEGTKNGKPIRTTAGIFAQIAAANIVNARTTYPAGVKFQHIEEYFYNIFRYGSSEKMGWTGNRALLTIQQIVRHAKGISWNIQNNLKEFGMDVSRLTTPFGTIVLKTHPLWNQITGGTTGTAAYYGLESWLCVLDMAELGYVYLNGSDTKWESKLQDNGLDGEKSGYITECGTELHHPDNHYLIKELVGFAEE